MIADAVTATPQANIQFLEQTYRLRERSEILRFLNQYPALMPVLLEAPDKIRRYFPSSQLFLQVVLDPELIDWVKLILSIRITLNPKEAVDKQNPLDKN